jgi:hypothetical protein
MADSFVPLARPWRTTLALVALLSLTACDQLGIETPGVVAAKKEAEGRAIGSACRHAVRSIEDCYASNPRASKAAIFTGWREMDEYMRENDIAGMPASPVPLVSPPEEVVPASPPGAAPATTNAPASPAAAATPSAAPVTGGARPANTAGGAVQASNPASSNPQARAGSTQASTGTVQLPAIPGRPSIAPAPAR